MYWLLFNLTQSRDTWKFNWAITSNGLDYGHVCGTFSCFMDWYGRIKPTVVGVTICQVFWGVKKSTLNKLWGVVVSSDLSWLLLQFLPPGSLSSCLGFLQCWTIFLSTHLLSPFSPVTTNSKLGYYANSLLIFLYSDIILCSGCGWGAWDYQTIKILCWKKP